MNIHRTLDGRSSRREMLAHAGFGFGIKEFVQFFGRGSAGGAGEEEEEAGERSDELLHGSCHATAEVASKVAF